MVQILKWHQETWLHMQHNYTNWTDACWTPEPKYDLFLCNLVVNKLKLAMKYVPYAMKVGLALIFCCLFLIIHHQ